MHPDEAVSASLRISDAEREVVIGRLRERTADGTLTLEEFVQRVERVLAARTRGDLEPVVADLAEPTAAHGRRPAPTRSVVSVMAGARRKGRWRCGERIRAVAVMGGCHLDFRGAQIDADVVQVVAVAVMGGINIIVPEGVEVSLDGLAVMGGKNMQLSEVPALPGSPQIVVHAYPVMGGVTVRSGPRKRAGRAASRQRPETGTAADERRTDGTVTLMFSDLCDYSGMTDRLGDVGANQLLREYTKLVRGHVAAHGGHVVKSHGDGLMVGFPSVARALRCAVDVQQALAKRNVEDTAEPLHVHIGIHAGEVVAEDNDYFGGAVIIASRLAEAARPDEILVSTVAHDLAAGSREFNFAPPRDVTLKGIPESRPAYAVDWQTTPT